MKACFTKLNWMVLFSGLSALSAFSACTKTLPYKDLLKNETQSKASIDTQTDYLYSASMLNASRSSADAQPFSSSDNRRVRLQWTKDSLRVMEIEKDNRFQGNKTNDKVILEIPVEHIDYQCTKDKYGECTSVEEENKDVTWDRKGQFKFKLEAAKSGTQEFLPILIDKTLGGNCYEEVSSKVLKTDLEETAINLEIERTFRVNLDCMDSIDNNADTSITAVYHYSMVKASAIVTPDFKPVNYPVSDQYTFGFFATEKKSLAIDNGDTEKGKTTLMNHWNPNRKEIVYYLSDEFSKPENAMIRDLTYKTFSNLNDGLAISGAQFRMTLKDPEHKNPGDIRNSMIILVEDPVASNIIGYGPQTEDPATGEIVSARTVMFLGTIKSYIRTIYDNILQEKKRAKQPVIAKGEPPTAEGSPQNSQSENGGLIIEQALKIKMAAAKKMSLTRVANLQNKAAGLSNSGQKRSKGAVTNLNLQVIRKDLKNYNSRKNMSSDRSLKSQYTYLQQSKNCSLGMNTEIPMGAISSHLASQFPDDAQPWEKLSDSEIQRAMNIILPEVWIPTLIHEMGHNLGLRHNFAGSEDAANFYSDQELAGLKVDHKIPFSSVMEYGDDLKALPVLGKYDIAALKYAYLGKVQLEDGSWKDVSGSIDEMQTASAEAKVPLKLKDYKFCTDEGVGVSAGCRQFDLGTSFTEMAQNEIQSYWQRYETRAFRHGKANMSLIDDVKYMQNLESRFEGLRFLQETYEFTKNTNGIADDDPAWEKDAELRDLKQASFLSAQFFLKILRTADVTCVLSTQGDATKSISNVVPLINIDPQAMSCFGIEFQPQKNPADTFVTIGQYGKFFQSKRDPRSQIKDADQVDVHGFWIDKLVASRMLFKRKIGNSFADKYSDNFTDRADIKPELVATVMDFMLGQVSELEDVQDAHGLVTQVELPVDTGVSHIIEKPLFGGLAKALGVPNSRASFSSVLAQEIADVQLDSDHQIEGRDFYDAVRVTRSSGAFGKIPKTSLVFQVGSDQYSATPDNLVAYTSLHNRQLVVFLDTMKPEKVAEIATRKAQLGNDKKPLPELTKLPKDEQTAWKIPTEELEAYVHGGLQSPQLYENLVMSLPF